ncbi:MAG TPA: hypothetical protein VFJ01_05545 [Oleiagrimonas sp.]|nr:hypothetical protein [Oleiagrimonas sp.]
MSMHAAHLENSDRLQRVLDVLVDGAEHTTMDLVLEAGVCAVNSIIAELRENGYVIDCQRRGDCWFYRLHEVPRRVS